jgi:glycosyltransferase involved in cell wall biosynthesis
MKIGFDAKRAFHNFTGLGNYSRTLIETLARYYPENEYHLFSPKNSENERLSLIKSTPSVFSHFPKPFFQKVSALWRSYFIKKELANCGVDIYHGLSHELPLSMPKGIKSVVTIHDLIHERYPQFYPYFDRKIYHFKFKKACKQADLVVAISEQTKRDIIQFYNIPSAKITVIYQSCDRQFYIDKPVYSLQEKKNKRNMYFKNPVAKYYLLYVGSIIERKNLLNLIKAIQQMEDMEVHLVVVGKGKGAYYDQILQYIAEAQMQNYIDFFYNVPFSDVPFLYQNADAMVYPSFFEGFGIPIIEALWSGCPVVTSKGSCFEEAGGDAAHYIDPYNVLDMAEKLRNILTDNQLRKNCIEKGYNYARRFHEKNIAANWIGTYKMLLEK